MRTIVGARLYVSGVITGKSIVKDIQINNYEMCAFLNTIQVGDKIKLKGLMPMKIRTIGTIPVKDIRGDYTLSEVTFYCAVGES